VGPKRKEESMMLHVQAVLTGLLDISMPNASFFQPYSCWCSCLVASGMVFNPLFGTWCFERHVQFEVLKKRSKFSV